MKTRLLSALMALCLMLSLLPVNALADSSIKTTYPVEGGNIYFNPQTGQITGADYSITAADIPAQIGGAAVSGIMSSAFGDDGIETVGIIKAFQVFAVNAFGLAVVTGRIGAECPAWMQ